MRAWRSSEPLSLTSFKRLNSAGRLGFPNREPIISAAVDIDLPLLCPWISIYDSVIMESNMPSVVRKSLAELVEEIIDVTPSPDMVDSQQANSYAIQVEAALARSRADTARQLSCDTDEGERLR
jgi:hypothetical protein